MSAPPAPLQDDETLLVGSWAKEIGGRTDDVDARIFALVTGQLVAAGIAESGWDQLFRDPRDGRYWELTFPHGSLYGGGPRQLAVVASSIAAAKYGVTSP